MENTTQDDFLDISKIMKIFLKNIVLLLGGAFIPALIVALVYLITNYGDIVYEVSFTHLATNTITLSHKDILVTRLNQFSANQSFGVDFSDEIKGNVLGKLSFHMKKGQSMESTEIRDLLRFTENYLIVESFLNIISAENTSYENLSALENYSLIKTKKLLQSVKEYPDSAQTIDVLSYTNGYLLDYQRDFNALINLVAMLPQNRRLLFIQNHVDFIERKRHYYSSLISNNNNLFKEIVQTFTNESVDIEHLTERVLSEQPSLKINQETKKITRFSMKNLVLYAGISFVLVFTLLFIYVSIQNALLEKKQKTNS